MIVGADTSREVEGNIPGDSRAVQVDGDLTGMVQRGMRTKDSPGTWETRVASLRNTGELGAPGPIPWPLAVSCMTISGSEQYARTRYRGAKATK